MSIHATSAAAGDSTAARTDYYHGTYDRTLTAGTVVRADGSEQPRAGQRLDHGRPAAMPARSTAVWVATSARDAAAVAALRRHSSSAPPPHSALRIYRVELTPFHVGPVAILEELQRRLDGGHGESTAALVREYWTPARTWHLHEVLGPAMTVLQQVRTPSERELYMRRWVHYNLDLESAESIL